MKNIFLLFVILILLLNPIIAISADWHQIPTDFKSDLNGIHFVDSSYGFGVTKNGVVIRFNRIGSTWKKSAAKFQFDMEGICFLSDGKTGFAFGEEGMVIHTSDSGNNWISEMITPGIRFKDMVFLDSTTGLLVGMNYRIRNRSNGVAFKTTDGGLSWDSVKVDFWTPEAITLSPEGTVIITGKKNILISKDRGKTWDKITHPVSTKPKVATLHGKRGLMAGMSGFVSISDDGGTTWNELKNLPKTISIFDILMLDGLRYYMVGTNGEVLFSSDGGKNWIPEASSAYTQLSEIILVDGYLFSCGRGGTLVYSDFREADKQPIEND